MNPSDPVAAEEARKSKEASEIVKKTLENQKKIIESAKNAQKNEREEEENLNDGDKKNQKRVGKVKEDVEAEKIKCEGEMKRLNQPMDQCDKEKIVERAKRDNKEKRRRKKEYEAFCKRTYGKKDCKRVHEHCLREYGSTTACKAKISVMGEIHDSTEQKTQEIHPGSEVNPAPKFEVGEREGIVSKAVEESQQDNAIRGSDFDNQKFNINPKPVGANLGSGTPNPGFETQAQFEVGKDPASSWANIDSETIATADKPWLAKEGDILMPGVVAGKDTEFQSLEGVGKGATVEGMMLSAKYPEGHDFSKPIDYDGMPLPTKKPVIADTSSFSSGGEGGAPPATAKKNTKTQVSNSVADKKTSGGNNTGADNNTGGGNNNGVGGNNNVSANNGVGGNSGFGGNNGVGTQVAQFNNTNSQFGNFESQGGSPITSAQPDSSQKKKSNSRESIFAKNNKDSSESVDDAKKASDGKDSGKGGANSKGRLIASLSPDSAVGFSNSGGGDPRAGSGGEEEAAGLSAEEEAAEKMKDKGFWGSLKGTLGKMFTGNKRTWGQKKSLFADKDGKKKKAQGKDSDLASAKAVLNQMKNQILSSNGQVRGLASTNSGVTDRGTSLFKSMCLSYHNYQVNNDINMGQTWCPKK